MWNIGKAARAGVVVHGKGADSVAGYPFISDVKDSVLSRERIVRVNPSSREGLEYGGDRGEITGEKYCGKIHVNKPLITPMSRLNNHPSNCTHHQCPLKQGISVAFLMRA